VNELSRDRTDEELHEADIESLERRIMELALERTGARHGAIFLYDPKADGLRVDFHVVDGLIVTLPGAVLRATPGHPKGIAFEAFENNAPYLCQDSSLDANYARYFHDVASIAAVPIPYQRRPIGVISVSTEAKNGLGEAAIEALGELAEASAKFLRRAQLYRQTREDGGRPFLIKGLSRGWLEVERRIERVAPTDAPVLIHGESGTGKDLVARAIHFNSRRAGQSLVVVNCAAIPEAMIESVLFGHVKGAFTGATFDKLGEFQKANGGTLFLDELGELPLALQAKVLRAVEYGEVHPLGSNRAPERVDVRVICATNRDLQALARVGEFREDLYFRLSLMTLEVPPLRSYKADNLHTLSLVFLQQAALKHGLKVDRISSDAMALLQAHDFPGNVRELKNAIEHGAIMATSHVLEAHDLPESIRTPASPGALGFPPSGSVPPRAPNAASVLPPSLEGALRRGSSALAPPPLPAGVASSGEAFLSLAEQRERWLMPLERQYLAELLQACGGNMKLAAARAGINTVTLYRLMRKRNLKLQRRVE
jgi:DNA-binding NtrC family response regulator